MYKSGNRILYRKESPQEQAVALFHDKPAQNALQ